MELGVFNHGPKCWGPQELSLASLEEQTLLGSQELVLRRHLRKCWHLGAASHAPGMAGNRLEISSTSSSFPLLLQGGVRVPILQDTWIALASVTVAGTPAALAWNNSPWESVKFWAEGP